MDRFAWRREHLLKVWVGLFAVAVVLCAILAVRQMKAHSGRGEAAGSIITVTREAPPKNLGPTINWGGAKR